MKQPNEKLTLRERVNAGLARNWKLAVVILSIVVVMMAGILILDTTQKKRIETSSMLAEDIQDAYNNWMQDTPGNRDDEAVAVLIDEALSDFPRQFAAQRALFTRGLMAAEKGEWEAAAEAFTGVAEKWSDSYLAPVSLFNAGSAFEASGDIEGAKAAWMRVAAEYSDASADAPEALFNLGRLAEAEGDSETALEHYREIGSLFPESRWTDLSKSRILVIESRS